MARNNPRRDDDGDDSDSVVVAASSSKSRTIHSSGGSRGNPSSTKKQQTIQEAVLGEDDCPACAGVPLEKRKKKITKAETWLACDECQVWWHWSCVRPDKIMTTNDLEEWYCEGCIQRSTTDLDREGPLAIKLKQPARKSARKKADVIYQKTPSNSGVINPWHAVAESRPLVTGAFPPTKASALTLEWLETDPKAFTEPIFIVSPEGLGMHVLPNLMSISEIAAAVGPEKAIDVIDVASQSGLSNWTLGKWASYFEDPQREKIRNVISLELSSTALRDKVVSPNIVRSIDWVEKYWPKDLMAQNICPQVTRYCLMSPGQSWTDWHVDFSASSVFYHILRGSKVFYFIRPTADNLQKYETWSGSAQQQHGVWLGDECDAVYKVELQAGNTMIIPSGWIHCVYTPSDSLVIGGNFLHSYNIATQLRVYQIELNTKVPKKFRFPYFVSLLWYVAYHYSLQIKEPQHGICIRVLHGLKALSAFLLEQAYRISEGAQVSAERRRVAVDNIPWHLIDDPEKLAEDFQEAVYAALGETAPTLMDSVPTFNAQDFLEDPAGEESLLAGHLGAATLVSGLKRKASAVGSTESLLSKSAKFKHFDKKEKPLMANGQSAQCERTERSTPAAISTTTTELRERPANPTIDFDEIKARPTAEKVEQKVEVKTTTAENILKKTVQGPEEGSWIVETRRVVTTIQRIYFPPLGTGPDDQQQTTVAEDEASIQEECKPISSHVSATSTKTGGQTGMKGMVPYSAVIGNCSERAEDDSSNVRNEISRMLDMAQLDMSLLSTPSMHKPVKANS